MLVTEPLLRDRVAGLLRQSVLSGALAPGTIHSALSLAARMGVSSTPVREAMRILVKEGLVEPVRNRGFRVTEPRAAELAEILALLEIPVVTRLARSGVPGAEVRAAALESVRAAESGDAGAYAAADLRFHLALIAQSGNRQLVRLVGDLRGRGRAPSLDTAGEHLRLLDLIRSGDAEACARLLRAHP